MFSSKMAPEPIPERVYALCNLLKKESLSIDSLKEKMEPSFLENKTSYFREYRSVASELGIITIEGNIAKLSVDISAIQSTESFRKYVNSILYKFENGNFHKVTNTYFKSDMKVLSPKNVVTIAKDLPEFMQLSLDDKELRGWRFWFAFLGFGYIHDTGAGLNVIPSCETFLRDLIEKANFEKNKKYTISEFFDALQPNIRIVVDLENQNKKINLGLSNALRILDYYGFLKIENILDERDTWSMYNLEINRNSTITHITICK